MRAWWAGCDGLGQADGQDKDAATDGEKGNYYAASVVGASTTSTSAATRVHLRCARLCAVRIPVRLREWSRARAHRRSQQDSKERQT